MVALTHMRTHNDAVLAARVPGVQLVLGGHDHRELRCVCCARCAWVHAACQLHSTLRCMAQYGRSAE